MERRIERLERRIEEERTGGRDENKRSRTDGRDEWKGPERMDGRDGRDGREKTWKSTL